MAIESMTGDEDEFFDILELGTNYRLEPLPNYNAKLSVTFEMSPNIIYIQRDVYNSFMLLGDVGSFSSILLSIGYAIVGLFTHNNSENYLARKLFAAPYDKDEPN